MKSVLEIFAKSKLSMSTSLVRTNQVMYVVHLDKPGHLAGSKYLPNGEPDYTPEPGRTTTFITSVVAHPDGVFRE